jgi:hypothetical protein
MQLTVSLVIMVKVLGATPFGRYMPIGYSSGMSLSQELIGPVLLGKEPYP